MIYKVALIFLFLFSLDSGAVPAQLLILRHAEKIESTDHLSEKGYKRAKALVEFFKTNPDAVRFGKPVAIFSAYKPGSSRRSIETMAPTAIALNLEINSQYTKKDVKALAQELLSNSKFDNKTVLICWQHSNIIELLKVLNSDFVPEEWPDLVFDQVILLENLDQRPHYKLIPQKLLPGDRETRVVLAPKN